MWTSQFQFKTAKLNIFYPLYSTLLHFFCIFVNNFSKGVGFIAVQIEISMFLCVGKNANFVGYWSYKPVPTKAEPKILYYTKLRES